MRLEALDVLTGVPFFQPDPIRTGNCDKGTQVLALVQTATFNLPQLGQAIATAKGGRMLFVGDLSTCPN
ncbi:hypothetical protein [Leptolyngbya boryana]